MLLYYIIIRDKNTRFILHVLVLKISIFKKYLFPSNYFLYIWNELNKVPIWNISLCSQLGSLWCDNLKNIPNLRD